MPATLIYQRPLRALQTFISGVCKEAGHADVEPAAVEHIALLIMALQTMSSIVTFMIGDATSFYSVRRDKGLDTMTLFQPVPEELRRDAKKPENQTHDFWHSGSIEEAYWGLLIRNMLEADTATWARPHPGTVIAMSIQFHTVGPVAKRLLRLINDVLEKCAPENLIIETVRLRLHSFLREPIDRGVNDDLDPHDTIAQGLHYRHFSGPVDSLPAASIQKFGVIQTAMTEKFGEEAALLITAAARKAGMLNVKAHRKKPKDVLSMVGASPLPPDVDCGRLLLAQLPLLKQLDDLLFHLATLDDEKLFNDILIEDKDKTEADSIFFQVPEVEEPLSEAE
jgi:hypothetical protein